MMEERPGKGRENDEEERDREVEREERRRRKKNTQKRTRLFRLTGVPSGLLYANESPNDPPAS